ncbi:hypothetical protein [Cupriavidus sp. BIS7]|uniref:hypothetical protein n=1 Tax=Cupriavidus sp. BIS7 TaxID=1217718 RepID=UPI00035C230E|nr:hypothetical protein [Cupriavidus sp. BIS7]
MTMTSMATNTNQVVAKTTAKAAEHQSSRLHLPPHVPGKRRSIKDMHGCLAGRVPPPTKEEIKRAVEAEEAFNSRKPGVLNLPPRIPGKTCSIKDMYGCLADNDIPPMTVEDMKQAVAEAVVQKYLRTFA